MNELGEAPQKLERLLGRTPVTHLVVEKDAGCLARQAALGQQAKIRRANGADVLMLSLGNEREPLASSPSRRAVCASVQAFARSTVVKGVRWLRSSPEAGWKFGLRGTSLPAVL